MNELEAQVRAGTEKTQALEEENAKVRRELEKVKQANLFSAMPDFAPAPFSTPWPAATSPYPI